MEPHDKRFSEFIDLLKSWISWKPESSSNVSRNFWMPDKSCRVCYECDSQFTIINRRHHCRICGRVFCAKCTPNSAVVSFEEAKKVGEVGERGRVCNYCFKRWEQELASVDNGIQLCSPELSPTFSTSSLVSSKSSGTGNSNNSAVGTYSLVPYCVETVSSQLFQIESNNGELENLMVNMDLDVEQQDPSAQVEFCMNRSDDEDDEYSAYHSDSEAQHFQSSSEYFNQVKYEEFDHTYQSKNEYISNENTNSNEVRPLDNIGYHCPLDEDKNGSNSFDSSPSSTVYNVDFENSKQLWYPPVPEDVEDERESTIFDDDDDGYEDASGEWGYLRSDSFSRDQSCEEHKQAMKNVVDGHFRALIAQLLQAENVPMGEENDKDSWMEIITALSWEAATLLKPDTSKGGGMDPGGYVKVKCIASGQRRESTVVRGVVCKKNVAHRRMSSRIEKPRFLILGGALEYHRVTNTLSSVDTLLQQEMDHLKMAVAKIASHHPSVLLVEKSVSRFAQDYLLAKNISLVLNIKRVLLERIARCTGAQIVPSVDHLMSQKLGYCDLFHVEKYFEEHANAAQGGKKSMKTLMFFEGCPKPLGCTILLKGAHRDELKKVKHVVHYGVFAAYHLALETSFLADEGASLPELPLKSPIAVALPDKPSSIARSISKFRKDNVPKLDLNKLNADEDKKVEIHDEQYDTTLASSPTIATIAAAHNNVDLGDCHEIEGRSMCLDFNGLKDRKQTTEKQDQENKQVNDHESISEDYSASDHQSILVSLSSRCIWKGTVCERAHLFRIKYYGSFDKPLGRFLRDNLFDEGYQCRACEFPPEAHVHCYTHCQGSLTISVRKQDTLLPGERDGKIWMWHRCLKCPRVNGLPPATRRVVMSDAAWGLSFGKFLELSFSNNAAASRVASCGHSLHRDCLRFYGFGRTVACFRYASVSIHSVYLPPSKLDFNYQHQDWTQKDADEVAKMSELLFTEIHDKLHQIAESKLNSSSSNESESRSIVVILQETLKKERAEFKDSLQKAMKDEMEKGRSIIDILEINKLRRQLLFQSYFWDQLLIHASNIIFKSKNMFGSTDTLPSLNVSSKPLKGYLSIDSSHSHPPSDEQINKSDIGKDQLVNKVPYLESDSSTVRRIQSDGQFLIMEGLSNTFDSKWSGDNVTPLSDASKSNFEILFSDLYRSINKDENASKVEALNEYNPIYITSFKDLERQGGARLLLPTGVDDIVIPIYDDEPTSIISYVLVSNDYNSQMTDDCNPNYADGKPFESLKRTESTNDGILSSSSVSDAATHTKAHAKVSFSVDGSSPPFQTMAPFVPSISSSPITIISKCNMYPDQKSTIGDLKLSISDLPMLSCHYIQKGLFLPKPHIPTEILVPILKNSLSRALSFFPALAGRFITDPDGTVYITCNDAGTEFTHAAAPSLTLDLLLPSTFTDVPQSVKSLFVMDCVVSYQGHLRPLAAFQFTELGDGAVFIGCTVNHAIVDGTSFWNFFNAWAELTRSESPASISRLTRHPDFRRNYFGESTAVIKFPGKDGPEVTFDATAPLRERIFHFSRDSILQLKSRANFRTAKKAKNGDEVFGKQIHDPRDEISSFQSLCAQLWISVTRARKHLRTEASTTFRMAVNCRHRVSPKIDPLYFGNAIQSIATTAKVGEVVANDLSWAAGRLHEGVVGHGAEKVRKGAKEWEREPKCFPLGNPDGAGVTMGSSPRFPMYDGNDFGWGSPIAVRSGKANKFDGKISAFPARSGDGVDLEVCLAPEGMKGLLEDDEFMYYVTV